jgi:O-antigen/teichoic acid export membrane protein
MLPAISADDRALAGQRAVRILRVAMLIGVVTVAAAAAVGPLLIPVVFGDSFQPSVTPFLWLLPGAIGYAAMSVTNSALLAAGSPGRSSVGPLVCLLTGIALDLALIPPFGASGAAAAATAAFTIGGITGLLLYRGRVRFAWRELLPGPADVRDLGAFASGALRRGRAA